MNKIDLEHRLLKGSPIYLGDIPVYSITLGEMADFKYSYTMCNYLVNILSMDDDKAYEMINLDNDSDRNTFNFIMISMYTELKRLSDGQIKEDMANSLLIATLPSFLQLVFREQVGVDFENMRFVIGNDENTKYLDINNFDEFRNIIKERNCLVDLDGVEDEDNPSNEMARKLLEKRKKLREKVKKAKQRNGDDEGLTLADLISIFAEAEKIPLKDVYDKYDIYQFNNQFNRLKIMEDYQVNIKALLAGAKSEEVKLQHWLSKIKKQED